MDTYLFACEISKIILIIVIYITVLLTIAPMIDNAFSTLHPDDSNIDILVEIISQLVTVSIIWYYLSKFMINIISKYITDIHKFNVIIGIVSGLSFIGLQTHLTSKLKYISHENPFRIIKIIKD